MLQRLILNCWCNRLSVAYSLFWLPTIIGIPQVAESETSTAELRRQLEELTQQLQESEQAHARTSSEHDLLTQQLSGRELEAERVPHSPPGSPARKLQASLEELADLR